MKHSKGGNYQIYQWYTLHITVKYINNELIFLHGRWQHGHIGRRADFRKYLEVSGVLNKMTGILMDLYENPVVNIPVGE